MDYDRISAAEIAQRRVEAKTFFDKNITTLSEEERKKFDALFDALLQKKSLTRGMHNRAIEELEWEKLPIFLQDKWISTFMKPNLAKKLFVRIRTLISWALTSKTQGDFELPDGEIVDKK